MISATRLAALIASWSDEAAVARASMRPDDYAARCQQTVEALRELERLRGAVPTAKQDLICGKPIDGRFDDEVWCDQPAGHKGPCFPCDLPF